MKNKVIVKFIVPTLDETYDLFIPVNKKVGKVINLVSDALSDITDGVFSYDEHISLYNRTTGELYNPDVIIKNTNIRNGTELVLL